MSLNANTALIKSGVKAGKATVRFLGTGANLVVVANSTVNSDIGNPGNDAVVGASITGMHFCLVGNGVLITRVVNSTVNVLVANLQGQGYWTPATGWQGDQRGLAGNIVVTFATGGLGTVELELSKVYPGGNPPGLAPSWTTANSGVNI